MTGFPDPVRTVAIPSFFLARGVFCRPSVSHPVGRGVNPVSLWVMILVFGSVVGSFGQNLGEATNGTPTAPPTPEPTEEVLAELNRVRTEPGRYAEFLATFRPAYGADGRLTLPGQPVLQTVEGVTALDEAIATLRALTGALPPLVADERLARVARELAEDQSRSGATGHTGSDGATMAERFGRHGEIAGAAGENIAYRSKTAREIVFSLVVDDGVAGRGHRQNILQADFRLAGVARASHPKWGQVCVIDFLQAWR